MMPSTFRNETLLAVLRGETVSPEDLRVAVALMIQKFNAIVERLYVLEHRPRPRPRPPGYQRPSFR